MRRILRYVAMIVTFILILTSIAMVSSHAGSTWLSGWTYRRVIYIEERAGVDLVDYYIRVELNSSFFDFSKVNTDGSTSDLRIPKVINYLSTLLIKWDYSKSAIIWIRMPLVNASSVAKYSCIIVTPKL